MKNLLVLLIGLVLPAFLFSQTRKTISFNYDWEMYAIPSTEQAKIDLTVRSTKDFLDQFKEEHLSKSSASVDSAVTKEITTALQGFEAEYPVVSKLPWEKVTVPHPARYEQALSPAALQFAGICYYRKQFTVAKNERQQAFIKFEGVMQQSAVWVNGQFVMQHQGGYMPFVMYLNPYLKEGNNEIILRVDNRPSPNTPPGKPIEKNGFLYWSGIYRNVNMEISSDVYISDPVTANKVAGGGVFVRYENVSECSADILLQTNVKNVSAQNRSLVVKHKLLDATGKTVQTSNESSLNIAANKDADVNQRLKINNPKLWSPDEPNLYSLVSEVIINGQVVDRITQKIGIRTLSFTRGGGFMLNGKPLRIVGTNRHEDHPYIGNNLSSAEQYRDLKRIKETGMNFVRIGHYTNSPDVYDICDSLGLMIENPIPGWQFFNHSDIFKERVWRDIRQMIRRDRNHPSVILWEASLNESYPPDSIRIRSAHIAHEEYPGDQFFTSGDTYASKKTAWDVPHNNWTEFTTRPQDVQPDRPGIVREYGDYEFGGAQSTTRYNRSHGEKALLQNAWNVIWEHNSLRSPEYYPWTIGDVNWAFFDGFEAFSDKTSDWGVMDVFRTPKFLYYFFQSQRKPYSISAGKKTPPMVYLANWWTERETGKVVVFSNCDEVALYVNNKLIRKQKKDSGPDSPYGNAYNGGNPFDGGNCQHLDYPPFTFNDIAWEKGELKAIGYINGKAVTTNTVRTPETAQQLQIVVDDMGMPLQADGSDVVFVHAYVVDKNGTIVCSDNETVVRFTITGEGMNPGPVEATARGGIASILVRSTTKPGDIKVEAQAKGLPQAVKAIKSVDRKDRK